MTLDKLFALVNYISAKVVQGNTLTPENFNDLLPEVSDIILNNELNKLIQDEMTPINDELLSTSVLRPFRSNDVLSIDSSGYATVKTDYVRWTSFLTGGNVNSGDAPVINPATVSNVLRSIKVVSDHNAAIQQGNVFSRAGVKPFCFATNDGFRFIPYDMATATMRYIRKPATAYFDYAISTASYLPIYLPPTSYLIPTATQNVFNAFIDTGSVSQLICANVTKVGADWSSTPSYTSASVELDWEERVMPVFVARILHKVGINLKDEVILKMMNEDAST